MCTGRSILCIAITLCVRAVGLYVLVVLVLVLVVCPGLLAALRIDKGCKVFWTSSEAVFIVGPTTFRSHHIPRSWITFYLTFWLGCFLTAPCSRELNTGAPQSPTLLLHRRRGGQLQLEVLAVEHTSCALGGRMQKPRLLVAMAMRELREDRQLVGDDDD